MLIQIPKNSVDTYEQIRDMVSAFAREKIRPQAERLDRDSHFPEDIFKQMAGLGLFGITTPEKYGGAGVDCYAYAIIMEELSRGYSAVADQCGLVELICTLLNEYGTDAQKDRYLLDITSFNTRVAYCLTEAEAGSDLSGIKTTAVKTKSGWSLSGSKLWINNAPFADIGLVLARTDPDRGHRGMSVFIVDLQSSGVTRGPQ